jgi:predicted CXXCH cytochrome family protein
MFRKLAGLAVAASLFFVGSAFAEITASAHDFRTDTWYSDNTEICKACHAPHANQGHVDGDPLWNRTKTLETFDMYVGLEITGTQDASPSGVSKLCLTCHDGTIALDSYGGGSGTGGTMASLYPAANVGTDLSDDHPISLTYVGTAGGLVDEGTASGLAGGGTIAQDLLFGLTNTVECGSCHDVHNAYTQANLLVKANTNSDLCQTCHAK